MESIPGLHKRLKLRAEPVFGNLLRSPGIDSQPGGIDSWAPTTLTNIGSGSARLGGGGGGGKNESKGRTSLEGKDGIKIEQ